MLADARRGRGPTAARPAVDAAARAAGARVLAVAEGSALASARCDRRALAAPRPIATRAGPERRIAGPRRPLGRLRRPADRRRRGRGDPPRSAVRSTSSRSPITAATTPGLDAAPRSVGTARRPDRGRRRQLLRTPDRGDDRDARRTRHLRSANRPGRRRRPSSSAPVGSRWRRPAGAGPQAARDARLAVIGPRPDVDSGRWPTRCDPPTCSPGDDAAKLTAPLPRLRGPGRAGGRGRGTRGLHGAGRRAPDTDALVGAIPAMSLTAARRYLLADGVERWKAEGSSGWRRPRRRAAGRHRRPASPAARLRRAWRRPSRRPEGRSCSFGAPSKRELPGWLVAGARERGFTLAPQAARALITRVGNSTERLGVELDRLALWAGDGGEVGLDDVESMTTDNSERMGWALADAIVSRDRDRSVATAEELIEQGEAVTPLVYGMASRLRSAYAAAAAVEAGEPAPRVEASLPMAPVRGEDAGPLRSGRRLRRPLGGDRCRRRPRVVDARGLRLRRRGRADPRGQAGGRARRPPGDRDRRSG